ncbi:lytic murein transglycosylase [Thaumasiovibrio subtropicus]|uniref:lytic murein transglycosylase n=1 Tax=Thaumasiovibrio subtropicus TaxID=1891207 RepID=UPI000B36405B|nr:lytic murein transglycosylase [Thaumasiovibrio subtropicus]
MVKKSLLSLCLLAASASVSAQVSFDDYVLQMQDYAKEKGISEQTISTAFQGVKLYESAISADKNQPERRLTLDEYLKKSVPQWKINQANQRYQKHKAVLNNIGETYGVSPKIIVALWGVESNFGKFSGSYDVISALTTMAYEGRREDFFKSQLIDALTILDQGHIERRNMKGSWAGAMGQSQFMPSSYLAYAADGDGDGVADIWNNPADVFASAANYLSTVGWQAGYRWGRQVTLPESFDLSLISSKKENGKGLQEWAELGVMRHGGADLPVDEISAWLIEPQEGRYYLVYDNYQALLDWNRSHHFVFSVVQLAASIRD